MPLTRVPEHASRRMPCTALIRGTMAFALIAALAVPREGHTSNYRVVESKSRLFTIFAELQSGYSGSEEDDKAYLAAREVEARPMLDRIRALLEKEVDDLGPPLASYSESLVSVMDETKEPDSVRRFLKAGNGPCRFQFVFYADVGPLHRVDVLVAFSSLPPEQDRSRLRATFERHFQSFKKEWLAERLSQGLNVPALPSEGETPPE